MKRLTCILGGHRWTIRDKDGEGSHVCSRCGKLLPQNHPSGTGEFWKDFADEPSLRDTWSGGGS